MLAIWSLVPLPFLKPAWTSGSSRFTYCWSLVMWKNSVMKHSLSHWIKQVQQRLYCSLLRAVLVCYLDSKWGGLENTHASVCQVNLTTQDHAFSGSCEGLMFQKPTLEKLSFREKEIQPVHSEGDQPWDFFGRNDAKAETPKLWSPHVKSWLIGKDFDAGRDWGQEEKGTEDEMAGWYHWLNERESEWTLGVGDGQRGLRCCDSWGCKESDTTERLNWTE